LLARRVSSDADSIARDRSAPQYTKRAVVRLKASADSLRQNATTAVRVDTVRIADTVIVAQQGTPTPPQAVDSQPTAPPPVVAWSHPFAPPSNGAVLAELPRDTVDVSYPPIARRIACTNLQACLDTAFSGDEILLAPGSVHRNVIVRPTSRASWVTVRTDVTPLGGPWERRTTGTGLATITSTTSDAPLTFASGAHHVRLVGVRITTTAPVTGALVQIGQGETSASQLPHHLTLDRVVIDPGANDVRRCVRADGAYLAIISSTLANCHSKLGDAQGVLAINAKGPLRLENNTIQGSHQSVMLGGGDPLIVGQVPSDVVIRRNDLRRPYAWRAQGWPAKTNVELKMGKRVLIEGNVTGGAYKDAQEGFCWLLKSENQDGGTGEWSETSDVTIRYNRTVGCNGGFNLTPLLQGPGVPMSRVTIYGNVLDSIATLPYFDPNNPADALQISGVADVVYRDNWTRNPGGRSAIYYNAPNLRFVATGNVFGGEYAIKSDGGIAGQNPTPSGIVSGNTLVSWGSTFTSWPTAPHDSVRDALLSGVTQ
jgi:hypothetical protein